MTADKFRCSDEARARDEPLSVTASLVGAWLLVEQPGAWGPEALFESDMPLEVALPLQRAADSAGVRVLLIRRRIKGAEPPVALLAHSGGRGRTPALVSMAVPEPAALLDLDLGALSAGDLPATGSPVDRPVYLVCTHGRHDICCADKGRPLFRALSALHPDRVWESSHIGGDRFAGNLLALPRGDYFGRLEPEDAAPFVSAYDAGRLDLAHYRGRSIRPRLVQAAEHFLRSSRSLSGFDEVDVVGYQRLSHNDADVVLRLPAGDDHRVRVQARPVPAPAYLTCRAQQEGHSVTYHLVSIEMV